MNIARSSTDVLCAQFCQNNHRECRALSQNQAHVRAHCGAQTDATMKISMCARVMIFFQPLLLVNFVFDRNEAYTAKSCLRCTRKSVSEFNLRYLNSIPKRVTAGGVLSIQQSQCQSLRLALKSGVTRQTSLILTRMACFRRFSLPPAG